MGQKRRRGWDKAREANKVAWGCCYLTCVFPLPATAWWVPLLSGCCAAASYPRAPIDDTQRWFYWYLNRPSIMCHSFLWFNEIQFALDPTVRWFQFFFRTSCCHVGFCYLFHSSPMKNVSNPFFCSQGVSLPWDLLIISDCFLKSFWVLSERSTSFPASFIGRLQFM